MPVKNAPDVSRRLSLFFLLASSFVVARTAVALAFAGTLGLQRDLVGHVVLVPALQLATLELLRIALSRRAET
jgi:hypothetical protein